MRQQLPPSQLHREGAYPGAMTVHCVLVHGIRTSRTMWRAQLAHLERLGVPADAIDLPGHGTRRDEPFTLEGALDTIDVAVRAATGPVLLVGHSMGGLLATGYAGSADAPPVAGLVGASCTALPRGRALSLYRLLARAYTALPGHAEWITGRILDATLPPETRQDFGAGGYAYHSQDAALASLAGLDLIRAIARLRVPTWWVNGDLDQLRIHERLFQRLSPHSELIVVPRTTHLLPVMRPGVFNALLGLAVATLEHGRAGNR